MSSYIRLVLLPSEHTVYKVDTLSPYVRIDGNRTGLSFALPKIALSMTGSYAILIDQGAVVGLGCSLDGPPTPGISSVHDWAFNVDGFCSNGYYLGPPDYTKCVGMCLLVVKIPTKAFRRYAFGSDFSQAGVLPHLNDKLI